MKPIVFGEANCRLLNITFAARRVGEDHTAPNIPIVLISGCAALAASELLFVDAHFGRHTVLDDLLGTMWSLVRSNRMSARDRQAARLWSNAT